MTILEPGDRARLRRFLVERFSHEDLVILAFDLGANCEDLQKVTTAEASKLLVDYFERRDNVSLLLTEALRQRYDPDMAQLLTKLPVGIPYPKVQIIVARNIPMSPDEIIADLAAKLNIGTDEVQLVSAGVG